MQHADLIRVHDGVEPVGNHDDGLASDDLGNGGVHLLLVLGIHESGCLVQYHDRGVFQNRPGKGDPLPFSARELFSAIPGHSVDAMGQTGQKFAALGLFRRRQNFLVRGIQLAQADIFQQAHVEQELLLGHIGDLVIQ